MVGIPQNEMVKKHIESLWEGKMTVFAWEKVTKNNLSDVEKKKTYTDEPCRISYKTKISTTEDQVPRKTQSTVIICDPTLQIPPGSVIEVMQHGKSERYHQSGQPAIYTYHQEIPVELEDPYG